MDLNFLLRFSSHLSLVITSFLRLTLTDWFHFYPVTAQCLPHKNHLVCHSFLIRTPVSSVWNTSFSPTIHLWSQCSLPLCPESNPLHTGAFVLSNEKRTKQRPGDPHSRPGSDMTQQFGCISHLMVLTKAPWGRKGLSELMWRAIEFIWWERHGDRKKRHGDS